MFNEESVRIKPGIHLYHGEMSNWGSNGVSARLVVETPRWCEHFKLGGWRE